MNEKHFTRFGPEPVVVAVDGTADGLRALKYGAQHALRTGRRLRLVHVQHETMPMSPMLPLLASETLGSIARQVVADAERQARGLGVEDVESFVAEGPRIAAILRHAVDAALVVVGPRSSGVRRFFTGSTSAGMAHRASCPVICVPAAWSPETTHSGVVAGVDDSAHGAGIVAAGFAAARERGCGLTVMHAWRPMAQYDAAIVEHSMVEPWREKVTRQLSGVITTVGADYPQVPVRVRVEYHSTVAALFEASKHADLLVIGRRASGARFGLPLGSIARAMIGAAQCPVELVPRPRHAGEEKNAHRAPAEAGFAPTF